MPRGTLNDTLPRSKKGLKTRKKNVTYREKANVLEELTDNPIDYNKSYKAKQKMLQSSKIKEIDTRLKNRRSSKKVARAKKLPDELGRKIASYL